MPGASSFSTASSIRDAVSCGLLCHGFLLVGQPSKLIALLSVLESPCAGAGGTALTVDGGQLSVSGDTGIRGKAARVEELLSGVSPSR